MDINTAVQNFIMGLALSAISILVPLLISYAIQGIRAFVAYTKSKTDDNVLRLIENSARMVVRAAEQSGLIGAIANEAAAKKAFAIQQMQTFLNSQGYTNISVATLSAAIEAAVREGAHKEGVGIFSADAQRPAGLALEGEPLKMDVPLLDLPTLLQLLTVLAKSQAPTEVEATPTPSTSN